MTEDDRRLAKAAKVARRRAGRKRTFSLLWSETRLLKRDSKGRLDDLDRAKLGAYQRELKWRGEGNAGRMVLS